MDYLVDGGRLTFPQLKGIDILSRYENEYEEKERNCLSGFMIFIAKDYPALISI